MKKAMFIIGVVVISISFVHCHNIILDNFSKLQDDLCHKNLQTTKPVQQESLASKPVDPVKVKPVRKKKAEKDGLFYITDRTFRRTTAVADPNKLIYLYTENTLSDYDANTTIARQKRQQLIYVTIKHLNKLLDDNIVVVKHGPDSIPNLLYLTMQGEAGDFLAKLASDKSKFRMLKQEGSADIYTLEFFELDDQDKPVLIERWNQFPQAISTSIKLMSLTQDSSMFGGLLNLFPDLQMTFNSGSMQLSGDYKYVYQAGGIFPPGTAAYIEANAIGFAAANAVLPAMILDAGFDSIKYEPTTVSDEVHEILNGSW